MTVHVITSRQILFGGWDLSAQHTANAEAAMTEELDATAYGDTTVLHEPGLKAFGLSGEGFWNGGDDEIDYVLMGQQQARNVPVSFLLTDGSVGSPTRSFKSMIGSYEFGAGHGELLKLSYDLGVMDVPVRGTVLYNASASGNVNGTAVQLGAVGATQYLYGILHVFSGTGSFIVKIQSDNAEGMGSPTDRITFATVATGTPRTYEWATPVAGSITDDWWRITATNPNTRDWAVIAAIR